MPVPIPTDDFLPGTLVLSVHSNSGSYSMPSIEIRVDVGNPNSEYPNFDQVIQNAFDALYEVIDDAYPTKTISRYMHVTGSRDL